MIHLRKPLRIHGLANTPANIRELVNVAQRKVVTVFAGKEKPIAAPGDIACDLADVGNVRGKGLLLPPAWHIHKGHLSAFVERGGHDADRRLYMMNARNDAPKVP